MNSHQTTEHTPEQDTVPCTTDQERKDTCDTLASQYLSVTSYIERLHRLLLDVVKDEFERLQIIDINSVQALLLYNIGDQQVTVGELRNRGYYQGSNVSYNLKKLTAAGYIHQERCAVDRRSVRIKLTEKGFDLRHVVCELWGRHIDRFSNGDVLGSEELEKMCHALQALERYWGAQIRYIY